MYCNDFGAVHKVRHAIFGQFWPPPPVTLCHTSRDLPKSTSHISEPPFLVGLVQKVRIKALCTKSLSIVREGFCPGAFVGVFCLGDFVLGGFCPYPLLSEYICYSRKLKITLTHRPLECLLPARDSWPRQLKLTSAGWSQGQIRVQLTAATILGRSSTSRSSQRPGAAKVMECSWLLPAGGSP